MVEEKLRLSLKSLSFYFFKIFFFFLLFVPSGGFYSLLDIFFKFCATLWEKSCNFGREWCVCVYSLLSLLGVTST